MEATKTVSGHAKCTNGCIYGCGLSVLSYVWKKGLSQMGIQSAGLGHYGQCNKISKVKLGREVEMYREFRQTEITNLSIWKVTLPSSAWSESSMYL